MIDRHFRILTADFRCWHEPDHRAGLARSVNRGRPEVADGGQIEAIDPFQTPRAHSFLYTP